MLEKNSKLASTTVPTRMSSLSSTMTYLFCAPHSSSMYESLFSTRMALAF